MGDLQGFVAALQAGSSRRPSILIGVVRCAALSTGGGSGWTLARVCARSGIALERTMSAMPAWSVRGAKRPMWP